MERSSELQTLRDASAELESKLEDKESQLSSSQTQMSNSEEELRLANQEAGDLQATIRQQELELARLREVLRRTEKELDERVAHLEQRCLFSEEERSTFGKKCQNGDRVMGGRAINAYFFKSLFFYIRQDPGGGVKEGGGAEGGAHLPERVDPRGQEEPDRALTTSH